MGFKVGPQRMNPGRCGDPGISEKRRRPCLREEQASVGM